MKSGTDHLSLPRNTTKTEENIIRLRETKAITNVHFTAMVPVAVEVCIMVLAEGDLWRKPMVPEEGGL